MHINIIRKKMLSLRSASHFGMGYYQMFTVKDEHIVNGTHYGVAVDVSISCGVENILYSFLDTLTSMDTITIVIFGTHTLKETFRASFPGLRERVSVMMNSSQQGSNLMVGLSELEGDVHVLISDGMFNEGPSDLKLNKPVHCLSLRSSTEMRRIASSSGGRYEVVGQFRELSQIRRAIRSILKKPDPLYFNVKIQGNFKTIFVPAMPRGGVHSFVVPTPHDGIAHLSYMDKDGVVFEEFCPFVNSRNIHPIAKTFTPCVSPIQKPIMRECKMIEY